MYQVLNNVVITPTTKQYNSEELRGLIKDAEQLRLINDYILNKNESPLKTRVWRKRELSR